MRLRRFHLAKADVSDRVFICNEDDEQIAGSGPISVDRSLHATYSALEFCIHSVWISLDPDADEATVTAAVHDALFSKLLCYDEYGLSLSSWNGAMFGYKWWEYNGNETYLRALLHFDPIDYMMVFMDGMPYDIPRWARKANVMWTYESDTDATATTVWRAIAYPYVEYVLDTDYVYCEHDEMLIRMTACTVPIYNESIMAAQKFYWFYVINGNILCPYLDPFTPLCRDYYPALDHIWSLSRGNEEARAVAMQLWKSGAWK